MKITSCRFECSAFRAEDEPRSKGPDVVFLGRSNVGKSSLINRLLGVKGLARTSADPGRTRSVNFYRVNDSCNFVDLPGYGYAKISAEVRRSWRPMVEGFLERRQRRIVLAVLLVDSRHVPTALDLAMQQWLSAGRIPYVVAATKADKLSHNEKRSAAKDLKEALAATDAAVEIVLVSAETGTGMRELWRRLDLALTDARDRHHPSRYEHGNTRA